MKTAAIRLSVNALIAFACAGAQAQSWMPPPESQRCPSKWGAGDERGSANHMKPASVLKAVFAGRRFRVEAASSRTSGEESVVLRFLPG